MTDMLDVYRPISYDELVSYYEVHSYIPYNTTRLENDGEIRITIHHQELNVLPCESSLHITGKLIDRCKRVGLRGVWSKNRFFLFYHSIV